jgi:hypothetical protein
MGRPRAAKGLQTVTFARHHSGRGAPKRAREAMSAALARGRPPAGKDADMATDYDYELIPPKLAKQKDLDTCSACCMSGLLAANMSPQQATEDSLVAKYATTKTGGISIDKLKAIAKDFGYIHNAFDTSAAARSILTDSFLIERLKKSGMLMVAWRIRDPALPNEVFFHAQIAWGVQYMSNQDLRTERALLHTMNPATKKYELYPLFSVYRTDNMPVFTCWPNGRTP